MKHDLTVPCFTSGLNVTVKKRDEPVKKYFPRTIPRKGHYWDTENDYILIHWKTVRKFTISEMAKRTGFSNKAIAKQLKRLKIYTKSDYNHIAVWRVNNDKLLAEMWLQGYTRKELSVYFNISPRSITSHIKRLGLRREVS